MCQITTPITWGQTKLFLVLCVPENSWAAIQCTQNRDSLVKFVFQIILTENRVLNTAEIVVHINLFLAGYTRRYKCAIASQY